MLIDPLAAEYLILAYHGEIAIKTTNSKVIHKWAVETVDNIFNRYDYVKNNKAMRDISSPSQSIIRMFIPQRKYPKPRPKKMRRDYSLEFIETIVSSMGGRLDNSESRYHIPESAPNYEQALATLKLLMKRAFELQIIPKGLWMYSMIIMLALFLCSGLILIFNRSFIEYAMAGICLLFGLYSFIRWRSLPSFKDVAKTIRDLVYSNKNSIDEMVESK